VAAFKQWFFKHTTLEGGAVYFSEQHIKYAAMTLSNAAIASLLFSFLESFNVPFYLVLLWVVPLLCCHATNLFLANAIINKGRLYLRKYFSITSSVGVYWWLGYAYILGWHGATELEVVWRCFIIFIVITFYLNAMQYSMLFLVINSSTVCVGLLVYLVLWADLSDTSLIRYVSTVILG